MEQLDGLDGRVGRHLTREVDFALLQGSEVKELPKDATATGRCDGGEKVEGELRDWWMIRRKQLDWGNVAAWELFTRKCPDIWKWWDILPGYRMKPGVHCNDEQQRLSTICLNWFEHFGLRADILKKNDTIKWKYAHCDPVLFEASAIEDVWLQKAYTHWRPVTNGDTHDCVRRTKLWSFA